MRKYMWPNSCLPSATALISAAHTGSQGRFTLEGVENHAARRSSSLASASLAKFRRQIIQEHSESGEGGWKLICPRIRSQKTIRTSRTVPTTRRSNGNGIINSRTPVLDSRRVTSHATCLHSSGM